MKHRSPHFVFAGGGTLGHVFPGLAVAAELRRLTPSARITFAGSGKPAEIQQVLAAGCEYVTIACRPLRRGMWEPLKFVADNMRGMREAAQYLRAHNVDVVIGLGGYASYPMARAAHSIKAPLILLEQNARPGRATRRLAAHASLVCLSFEAAKRYLRAACPVRVTGNPVRQTAAAGRANKKATCRRLLVLGGSLGAQSLNEAVPEALFRLASELRGWSVLHQTGESHVAETRRRYAELGVGAHVAPFVENLPVVMANADLAISRAGGTTLAELAAAGLPAVLVPYPTASDDHQRQNAEVFAASGACRVVDGQHGATSLAGQLAAELPQLLASSVRREEMSRSMLLLARPAAAWHVAHMIMDHVPAVQQCRPLVPLAA